MAQTTVTDGHRVVPEQVHDGADHEHPGKDDLGTGGGVRDPAATRLIQGTNSTSRRTGTLRR